MSGEFNGKTIVVLGASSDGGVGWAAAKRFSKHGAHVVVTGRRFEPLQQLAKEIGGTAIQNDISDEAAVKSLAARVRAEFGKIYAVVNAIGHVVPGTLETVTLANLQQAMATEFYGNVFMFQQLGPLVEDGGAIVVNGAIASTHYSPGIVPYASAKSAGNYLVKVAAIELAPRGIRVNGTLPGLIDTPMIDGIRDNVAVMKVITKEIPLGRAATADEVAAACEWLCSADCFMTGTMLQVDGGNHLRRMPHTDEMPSTAYAALS